MERSEHFDHLLPLPFVLSRAALFSRQLQARLLRDAGIDATAEEGTAMLLIGRFDSGNVSALAEGLGRDRTTTSRLIESLERKGWVERKVHPTDRRAVCVVVTPSGHEVVSHIAELAKGITDELIAGITPEDLFTTLRVISTMASRGQSLIHR
jgi:DNA-binding MarR family transcriptional regulator